MIKNATFIASYPSYKDIPEQEKPEIAFIGRSNVGKSSLINMITNKKQLAKTSAKPGKTRLINHFLIDNQWYLVDLPGYGWAQISKKERANWVKMIDDYLFYHKNLYCLCVLLDSRHEPQKIDIDFINKVGQNGVPIILIFTKTDKSNQKKINKNMQAMKKELLKTWEEIPPAFLISSITRQGKSDLESYFQKIISH